MKTLEFEQLVDRITKEVMKRLQMKKESQKVILLGSDPTLISSDSLNYLEKRQKSKKRKLVILAGFSFDNLVNSLNFNPKNETEQAIVEAIKDGEDVLIIKEGCSYLSLLNQGRYGLKQKIQEFEDQFYQYGARFITLTELKSETTNVSQPTPYEDLTGKKFLTAKDLLTRNIKPNSTIKLPKTIKLTDLANDYLREQKISIRKIDEK